MVRWYHAVITRWTVVLYSKYDFSNFIVVGVFHFKSFEFSFLWDGIKKSVKSGSKLSLCVKRDASEGKWVFKSEGWSLIQWCCLFSILSSFSNFGRLVITKSFTKKILFSFFYNFVKLISSILIVLMVDRNFMVAIRFSLWR